ncbi:MAG: hypothetical protein R3F34_13780 [Planctomycetota bacterium]
MDGDAPPLRDVPGERAGDVIDRYTLVEPLGEGGMGTVWRAMQSVPVKREVALKIVKLGMDTREVVQRFEAERQALAALMDHPVSRRCRWSDELRRPYFVMESSRARRPRSSRRARLGLRERLGAVREGLRRRAARSPQGDPPATCRRTSWSRWRARPCAQGSTSASVKATSAQLHRHDADRAGQIVGTPEHMASEQSPGDGTDVDTRADVYSLGVMLYELLTGTKTFGREARARDRSDEPCARSARSIPGAAVDARLEPRRHRDDRRVVARVRRHETLSKRLEGRPRFGS